MLILIVYSICLGAIFGSFINLVVWRLPIGQSIVKPRSYCPKCKHKINWRENIPLISWILLKGKCKFCCEPIPFRYFFVEVLSIILFLCSIYSNPTSFESVPDSILLVFGWILIVTLLTISIIDFEHLWIPQSLVFLGCVCAVLLIS